MTRFRPICELCGRRTLCDLCRGNVKSSTSNDHSLRQLIHTVKGTPSQVVNEWQSLARQEENPS